MTPLPSDCDYLHPSSAADCLGSAVRARVRCRGVTPTNQQLELEISSDPDNVPPRSRLFLVVPKQADAQQIQVCGCKGSSRQA